MKNMPYMFNLLLVAAWGIVLTAAMICRAFCPAIILPPLDIPLLQVVSLLVLLAEHWIDPDIPRSLGVLTILAAFTLGLLPMCAGFISTGAAVKLGVAGGITCLLSVVLFDSIMHRLSDAGGTRIAPLLSVFILFLAGQCFTNIFF